MFLTLSLYILSEAKHLSYLESVFIFRYFVVSSNFKKVYVCNNLLFIYLLFIFIYVLM